MIESFYCNFLPKYRYAVCKHVKNCQLSAKQVFSAGNSTLTFISTCAYSMWSDHSLRSSSHLLFLRIILKVLVVFYSGGLLYLNSYPTYMFYIIQGLGIVGIRNFPMHVRRRAYYKQRRRLAA